MKKQELITILKKMAENALEVSEYFEDGDERQVKISNELRRESWTLQTVINMLENKKLYEEMKAIWLKEGK